MRAYEWSLPFLVVLLAANPAAFAGSQSLLDPYANIQPPSSKSSKNPVQNLAPMPNGNPSPTTTSTYVTMPAPEGNNASQSAASSGGILSGMSDIKEGCTKTVKAAGSGLISGTKAAGVRVAQGGKIVKDGVAKSTKKVRAGLTAGARVSGEYFVKGARVIGQGLKTTGEKVKGGAGIVGNKVVALPQAIGRKVGGDNQTQTSTAQNFGVPHNQAESAATTTTLGVASGTTEKVSLSHKLKSRFGKIFGKSGNEATKATASSNPTRNLPQ